MKFRSLFLAAGLVLASSPAFAHLNPAEHGSFATGISHPLFGLDHILVMVAVGLWAFQNGGRSVWLIPSAFVATMLAGFGLSMAGVPLPFVEPAIMASVVALGLLVAMAVRLPVIPSAAIVSVFALFHGHAHGAEIGTADELSYAAGFALATALLHASGIAIGWGVGSALGADTQKGRLVVRSLGAVTAVLGLSLFVG
ncbi:HupE/UreJ family protein [Roseibium aggregatum]|uniref:HupE/UreJ family protein n=1 Tax=Roseibium aggregatum TaxID=187304 RepID=A0A926NUH3_9HYPH|nr:HupE/UreJ family protein [Roseibium aggregatum]MBD1547617.1 HupE/UreJ family protein [Roseibium aggregatum]